MNYRVLEFTKFMEDNNGAAIAKSMFDFGYTLKDGESIAGKLYKIFEKNRLDFIKILTRAGFNEGAKNYTTDTNVLVEMRSSINKLREGKELKSISEVDTSVARNWFNDVLDTMVGGGESTATTTQTVNEPASGAQTKTIVVAVGAFIGVGALIYFLMKK